MRHNVIDMYGNVVQECSSYLTAVMWLIVNKSESDAKFYSIAPAEE